MTYPTLAQVEAADRFHLCEWSRFLPSPGEMAAGTEDFPAVLEREAQVMHRIVTRLRDMGGMTPSISKALGWEKR
jgi:hypothetical protein